MLFLGLFVMRVLSALTQAPMTVVNSPYLEGERTTASDRKSTREKHTEGMMTLSILAAIVLGVLAVTRLSRVYELTSELRGKREWEISDRDSKHERAALLGLPFACISVLPLAHCAPQGPHAAGGGREASMVGPMTC